MDRRAPRLFGALAVAASAVHCRETYDSAEAAAAFDAGAAAEAGAAGDAGLVVDGGPDVVAGRFCDGHRGAEFCEDFDDEVATVTGLEVESSAGTASLTRESSRSEPRALRMTIPAGAPPGSFVVFKRAFDGARTVRLEVDWNAVETLPGAG